MIYSDGMPMRSPYLGSSEGMCTALFASQFLRSRPFTVAPPQSVNRWARPNSPASASSTIMYRMLGRARPKTQRLMV